MHDHLRFSKLITESKEKLINNSNFVEELEDKLNRYERERFSNKVLGITSKKDIDKQNEFKLILDNANTLYQSKLTHERDLRRAIEYELEKIQRSVEMRNENKTNKPMQTNLKWIDGDIPVKASFW